jgi:hypothetical protein
LLNYFAVSLRRTNRANADPEGHNKSGRLLILRSGSCVSTAAAADNVVQADACANAGGSLAVFAEAIKVVVLVQSNQEKILTQNAAVSSSGGVIEILIGMPSRID